MGRYDTVGQDLVNHCVNDILCTGAEPLFFLDYIGTSDLSDERKLEVVGGMAKACEAHGCALIGGETADMPDTYAPGDFDLVGFIVGVVEREHVIDNTKIREGDVLLALPSTGLHTNGYSLVRQDLRHRHRRRSRGRPRGARSRLSTASKARSAMRCSPSTAVPARPQAGAPQVHGLAHITGGGLTDNMPRILPDGLAARFDRSAWRVPALFSLIQERGNISDEDMFHTFNMGLGMIVVVAREDADAIMKQVPEAWIVGAIIKQIDDRRVIIE